MKEMVANRNVLVAQNLSMCCEDIRIRVMGPIPRRRIQFGVAHARVVHDVRLNLTITNAKQSLRLTRLKAKHFLA